MAKRQKIKPSITVRFVTKWVVSKDKDNGDVLLAEFAARQVSALHTKRYHNCLPKLMRLRACARNLIDYLCEQMNVNNIVGTGEQVRGDYRQYMEQVCGAVYGDDMVKKALAELHDNNLLMKLSRGYSRVNPEYFWKNEDTHRGRMLAQIWGKEKL